MFKSVLPPSSFLVMMAALFIGLFILSYQLNYWQAGYDMGRGVMDLCWTCLETCLELPKSHYLVSLYSDLIERFEGSMFTSENSSIARESSHVIILKSRLNSTGHSACMSKVHDIFDHQTHVLSGRWQLMCLCFLQPWNSCNSTTAPVRNITKLQTHTLAITQQRFSLSSNKLLCLQKRA